MSRGASVPALLAALVLAALVGLDAAAQEPYRISTYVEPRGQAPTDTGPFQYVIEIAGSSAPQRVRPPEFPSIEGLAVVGGPNTNSSLFWSAGGAQATYKISYQLLAERPGRFEIPPLEFTLDGQAFHSQALAIEVVKGRDPSRGVTPGGTTGAQDQAPDPLFLELKLGAEEVWVGEAIPLTLTLYAAVRWGNGSFRTIPEFDGFWVEELAADPAAEQFQTRVGGRPYIGYPLRRHVLVPLRAGEFEIGPYVVEMQVQERNRGDVFDIFSFGRTQTVVRKTPPLAVRVKPLPPGRPAGFGGAVGRFTVQVSIDRERAAVNDAVALRATVEGRGALQSVEPPTLEPPPGIKIFDAKVSDPGQLTADGLRSRKTWEWILVPLEPGELRLPAVRFPYFDPQTGRYEVAEGAPLLLAVERGDRAADPTGIRAEIQMQRRDLAYIKPLRGRLAERHVPLHERTSFRVLLLLPLLWTPIAIWVGRQQSRLRRDHGAARARRAGSRARRSLRAAGKRAGQIDSAAFHEELARTLVGYVADRFNRSAAGLTYEAADELLASRDVDPGLRRRYRTCLERCDFARFVPAAAEADRRSELLAEAGAIVDALERAW